MRSIPNVLLIILASAKAFSVVPHRLQIKESLILSALSNDSLAEEEARCSSASSSLFLSVSSRRNAFRTVAAAAVATLTTTVTATQRALAEETLKTKVLVLGGTGFVGSRVVSTLQELGVEVIATSTNGRDGTMELDLSSSDTKERVQKLAQGASAVISCVGTIGTPEDEIVNAGTGMAALGAKAAGVDRFVYITVAPEVKQFAQDIEFLQGYMKGKSFSREAVLSQFGDKATLIEPTFIYGGGSFEVMPPRVPGFYGKLIEGLLSAPPIRQVERILSPGIIKIALEPPVPVESVAKAAVAGALGKSSIILDTYDKIQEAATLID